MKTDSHTEEMEIVDVRAWVFSSPHNLEEYSDILKSILDPFVGNWKNEAHPTVSGRWEIRYGHFLVILADTPEAGISGCSMDQMRRKVRQVGEAIEVNLLGTDVYFRDKEGNMKCVSRPEFNVACKNGDVGPDTLVYDTTLTSLDALSDLERPLKSSWHNKLYERTMGE